jgi:hypothetical protein
VGWNLELLAYAYPGKRMAESCLHASDMEGKVSQFTQMAKLRKDNWYANMKNNVALFHPMPEARHGSLHRNER